MSIYASQAVVGMHYVTKGGYPVTVLERNPATQEVTVRTDLTRKTIVIPGSQLLWPYQRSLVSREAILTLRGRNP